MAAPEFLKKGWTDFKGLTPLQQMAYVMVMVGIISGMTVAVLYSTRPDYQVLATNLEAADAGQITSYLKDNKIPYKLAGNGTTVMVPSDSVYEVRMALATSGQPLGGAQGWELFDDRGMGMTEAEHRVAYLRALQGELARTLQQMDKVEHARVHLVLPAEALFEEDQEKASAAVIVKLANGADLSRQDVEGIVYLVSSAVEKLKPAQVTVMNAEGKVLSRPEDDDATMVGLNNRMLEFKRAIEQEAERKIVHALSRSVGPDKVVASVTADVSFDRVVQQSEKYDADDPVLRSRQEVSEVEDSEENNKSGAAIPGVMSNTDEAPDAASVSSTSKSNRTTRSENYEISSVRSETVSPAGRVERLSVAVLLDGKYVPVEDTEAAGGAKTKYVPWEPSELDQFRSLAMTAVGYDRKRGDQIEVLNMSFGGQDTVVEEAFQIQGQREWIMVLVKWGLIGLGTVLFFFFVLRPLIGWLTTEEVELSDEQIEMLLPGKVRDVEERLLAGDVPVVEEVEEKVQQDDELADMRRQIQDRRRVAVESARRDRKAITMMVRKWLKEDMESKKRESPEMNA